MADGSIVVLTPVYEDREASTQLLARLLELYGERLYCIVVDDGSIALPVDAEALGKMGIKGEVLRLKRNVGHQRAIAIGLGHLSSLDIDAEQIVIMDADGEDRPETIDDLLRTLDDPSVDIAVAQRRRRSESLQFRAFYVVYTMLFWFLTGKQVSFGNFMAIKPMALKRLSVMSELWLHLPACVLTSKLRLAYCPNDRGTRYAGESKMNFVGLALHGFRGLMVFAEDVLVRVGAACALIALAVTVAGIVAIGLKTVGWATPGWFSVALGILFLVFLQTGTLTLMTLMLTGVAKSSAVSFDYRDWLDHVDYTAR